MSPSKLRIALFDSNKLIRIKLKIAIAKFQYDILLDSVSNPSNIDVIVINLPLESNDKTFSLLDYKKTFPRAELICIIDMKEENSLFDALSYGSMGYIAISDYIVDELCFAIKKVANGGVYFSHGIDKKILLWIKKYTFRPSHKKLPDILTRREIEIIKLYKNGYKSKEISDVLAISYQTIRTHKKNIYRKLSVSSLQEALCEIQSL